MPRRRPAELHINHERWLVSYADFITLLFAFFVVMYSVSQVSETEYRALSETLVEAFDRPLTVRPIQVGELSRSPSTSAIDLRGDALGDTDAPELGEPAGMAALGELGERMSDRFADLIGNDLVAVQANEFWLQIELRDSILFTTGSAELSAQARELFTEMAELLADYDNPVQIEGHTDNRPISNLRYPSNWELSTARASSIVKVLMNSGVSPERLAAVGYGEHRPAASNATEQGRARNRRVTLMIAREAVERPQTPWSNLGADAVPSAEESGPLGGELFAPEAQAPSDDADTLTGTDEPSQSQGIVPVQLEGGGLLFSSDPDLPREQPRSQPQRQEPDGPQ